MRRTAISIPAVLAAAVALALGCAAVAQTAPTRIVGSATAVAANTITVKPDHGTSVTLAVPPGTRILETQPGAKTLAGATAIPLSAIAPGDRVFAIAQPSASGSGLTASTLIAMKASAIAERHQAEESEWQRNGIGGLVKSVDAAAGTVTIVSGPQTVTITTTPQTVIRRYSPDSIAFSAATPSTLAAIHPGDQLRARGTRTPDGSGMTAAAIVSGSFRNIAGTIVSINSAANTLTVRDLKTKKQVVIHINAESQMHQIPEPMARYLAARLRRDAEAAKNRHEHRGAEAVAEHGGEHAEWRQPGQARRASISQMLERTPKVTLAELHKGQALMIVATEGTPESATAVTLLSGVEPILTAPASATAGMFSASWNVSGNAPQGAGGAGVGTGTGTGGTQ